MDDITPQFELFSDYLNGYRSQGKSVFASSSFQTHSLPMLHMISRIDRNIPIYFLDTGYHFPETLEFRDEIAKNFGLTVLNVSSPIEKVKQRDENGQLLFSSDPDHCCYLNKTLPMEPVLHDFDVWISGVRKDQSSVRAQFSYEQPGKHNTLRLHPMLEWNSKMIWAYRKEFDLPVHPLEERGYLSIGCLPCTRKFDLSGDTNRKGRWSGMKKTECGLHTDLANQ